MPTIHVIHPGGLSPAAWTRLASHVPVQVHDLEAVTAYWADDPSLTVAALAASLPHGADDVLVGWGFGGIVADALAAYKRPRHLILLDTPAPGSPGPDEADLLRSFGQFLGARRGRRVEPAGSLEAVRDAAVRAGALRPHTPMVTLRSLFEDHVRRELRDHRLAFGHVPSGFPLTVVRAAGSEGHGALGWERFGRVETLVSAGDHYSMVTDPGAAAHLAMALQRWLVPTCIAA